MSEENNVTTWSAFKGTKLLAAGPVSATARKLHALADGGNLHEVLIFDDATAQQIDVDFSGTFEEVLKRLKKRFPTEVADQSATVSESASESEAVSTGRAGRPKLGVVAREVTLLPRHWEWLGAQPGGASVALRKLVEEARRSGESRANVRASQDAAYKFMTAMAGNQPGFEEAIRALFARKRSEFDESIKGWPKDIRQYAARLAAPGFES